MCDIQLAQCGSGVRKSANPYHSVSNNRRYLNIALFVSLLILKESFSFLFGGRQPHFNYYWVEDDPTFDCFTPVAYYSDPYSTGVYIRKNLVASSENPFEYYFKRPDYHEVYAVDGSYDKTKEYQVIHNLGDMWGKTYFWVMFANAYANNPLHDIMFFHIKEEVATSSNLTHRRPYYLPVAKKYAIEEPSGWLTGAFALTDKWHVQNSSRLVPIYYDENVLADCDEWFPKYWGYFICILNIDNYPVIHSGAPLIQNKHVFGIASFTMTRGKESIFAFTDLRPYRDIIYDLEKKYSKNNNIAYNNMPQLTY